MLLVSRLCSIDNMINECGAVGGARERNYWEKCRPSPAQILSDLRSNPGRHTGKPATKGLSCGTAPSIVKGIV
jgi:hypothetical protein